MSRPNLRRSFLLLALLIGWSTLALSTSACGGNVCNRYFQELKRRCQLNSTKEGAKLDEYLTQPFRPCQLDICTRASLTDINCADPETHVPGGLTGRFLTCE